MSFVSMESTGQNVLKSNKNAHTKGEFFDNGRMKKLDDFSHENNKHSIKLFTITYGRY